MTASTAPDNVKEPTRGDIALLNTPFPGPPYYLGDFLEKPVVQFWLSGV